MSINSKLLFDEVDVLFFALLDVHQQIASHEILDRLAVRDGGGVHGMRFHLPAQIALQDFLHILADEQLAQILQVRQAIQKQDALDQPVGMLHFIDGFFVLELAEPLHAPVVEHARVQEILIDRGELVLQRLIEEFQYFSVALHDGPLIDCA